MNAKQSTWIVASAMLVVAAYTVPVRAAPPFTYQGQLKFEGVPVNGTADLTFNLYDRETAGVLLDRAQLTGVSVTNGLFSVELTFGRAEFNGDPRWLEIYVRTAQGEGTLAPRQPIRPAPYALYAFDSPAGTGGDSPWSISGANIYYNTGNVGVGTMTPGSPLTVAGLIESSLNGFKFPDGTIQTSAATGGGSSPWLTGHDLIYYNGGRVGIGTADPQAQLDVIGGIAMNGFHLRASRYTAGHVLTSDANGAGRWLALPQTADPLWGQTGNDIYYDAGKVGIGTNIPSYPLHVTGSGAEILVAGATATGGIAIRGTASGAGGVGVKGINSALSGTGSGLYGSSLSSSGRGVFGENTAGGWAGYFNGKAYFDGTVGIGTTSPAAPLDVNGIIRTTGFRLTTAPSNGYVLTCDANGVGTWQTPTGGGSFDLPYTGTVDADNATALSITNSGSGGQSTHAVSATITSASSDASAGYFDAVGYGMAIYATSDDTNTVRAFNSGSGIAFYGTSSGNGGGYFTSSLNGGYGVRGHSSSTGDSTENRGGWFTAQGQYARAVYAESSGTGIEAKSSGVYGSAVKADALGAESYGVTATSPWVAVHGTSAGTAARFDGRVRVYKYGTSNTVFLVDSDGITKVDVLQILGGADLSEQFDVIDDQAKIEPGMVVCIDPNNAGKLAICEKAFDHRVAGIVSGAGGIKTGMMMGQGESAADGAYPVALTGRVYVWADAANGAIEPGDLLTTSDVPGHAMKVTGCDQAHGATLGKAMSRLAKDERGLVLVLVSLQ